MPSVYLYTNVISGLAKGEFDRSITDSILKITAMSKEGRVALLTSEIAADELNQIPERYRQQHYVIYNLIRNVAFTPERLPSNLILQGFGGGSLVTQGFGPGATHPVIRKLEALIPVANVSFRS